MISPSVLLGRFGTQDEIAKAVSVPTMPLAYLPGAASDGQQQYRH
jgi:hypothetical protein